MGRQEFKHTVALMDFLIKLRISSAVKGRFVAKYKRSVFKNMI
jgi:hypothetical protein